MKAEAEVDEEDVWRAVFGSGGETYGWWFSVIFLDGANWENPGKAILTIEDPDYEDGSTIAKEVTVGTLIEAVLSPECKASCDPCTGGPITLWNLDSWDSCMADVVMQIAVLGKVVYG